MSYDLLLNLGLNSPRESKNYFIDVKDLPDLFHSKIVH